MDADFEAEDRAAFLHFIASQLSAHPNWLYDALTAVTAGMNSALNAAHRQAGAADMAMRSALALANTGRLDAETKQLLNASIIAAIRPEAASQTEREWLERNPNWSDD